MLSRSAISLWTLAPLDKPIQCLFFHVGSKWRGLQFTVYAEWNAGAGACPEQSLKSNEKPYQ